MRNATNSSAIALAVITLAMLANPAPALTQPPTTSPPGAPTPLGPPVLAPTSPLATNRILNGDFEISTLSPGCYFNVINVNVTAALPNITAYGAAAEIDVMNDGTSCSFAGPAQSGRAKLAIHRQVLGAADEFSFGLTGPVLAGNLYQISFYAWPNLDFDPNFGAVEIGLSSSPTSFGTLVFSGTATAFGWTHFSSTFSAPVNADYVTVRAGTAGAWTHIDNFALFDGNSTPTQGTTWSRLKSIYR